MTETTKSCDWHYDGEFWLRDAASILRENGSVQHATHIDRAAGCQAVMAEAMREAYVALAFAFNRLHESPHSRDTELCDSIGKARGRIEHVMKEAGYAL